MSTRTPAAALAPGLLLALVFCAGEAAAQTNVCRGGAYTGADGGQIECVDTSGSTDIVIDPGSVNVARIHGDHRAAGDIIIRIKPGITITGSGGNSVLASRRGTGDVSIVITGGTLTGIASSTSYGAPGTVSVSMSGGTLSGRLGAARNGGSGNAYVTVSGDATIRNTGDNDYGVFATNNGLGNELSVRMTGGSVETTGSGSHGIFVNASNDNGATGGPAMSVDLEVGSDLEGGSVRTRGSAHGVFFASYRGSGDASFRMTGGSVVTEADDVHGVDFWLRRFAAGQTASARMTGGSIVAEGLGGRGLASLELNLGSFDVMTGAKATIEAPFAVGMEGLLEVDASPTGRLVFAHGGTVKARDVGVLARAARSSGHTMGAGAQWADDAARTAPMIHVTSSGDVTVGAPVSDAFIRARIAGTDETLSAAEQAVLSAIMSDASDASDALTTALAALSDDDYDADWKAEAEDLRRKRAASSAVPTGDGPAAQRAAEEILSLSRAGVRAYALSHTGIVDHVRAGDALSDAERAVLDAVLTKGVGSELETALTTLTGAAYTTAWKNTVRRLAATYNAGDIQVDVTGGAIAAEGNGVEALYAVPHDSNGAIAVTIADGATVTGRRNGIYVRGAGAGAGSLRAQSVTVNGRVMGGTGTGAGVRMIDGGRLTVGRTGRIGATSGVGVLSDGAGDLHATVAGRVEGDIRMAGTGALTLAVPEGGAVTGTVRDPVGLSTVVGSIGRLHYTSGATVTVASTGALTGVEVDGGTEALRAEAGDLDVTVAGRVAGDLRAPRGGTLKLSVPAGGVVTGTVRDPVGLSTVVGSIGRLLYSGGATVTVAATGRLTGVEVDGGGTKEALRSESGDLSLTVADGGMVTGDVQARGGGALTLDLKEGGTIAGTVHDPVGPLTVVGSIGRLLYSGGATVTVTAMGALTGVEVDGGTEALRSEAGDLSMTVAGMVTGDVLGLGDGDHTVTVVRGGRVTGTIHLAASTVRVAGTVGRVRFDNGGQVTVGRTGRLTGIEGVAIRNEDGVLRVTSAGEIKGDIVDVGERPAVVTVEAGGTVTGSIDLPAEGSAVTVDGTAGRVRLDGGGTVTVGGTGQLTSIEDQAITSGRGDLEVEIRQAPGETAEQVRDRIQGTMRDADGALEVRYVFADGRRIDLGAPDSAHSAPIGAYDLGIVADGDGVRVGRAFAPRSRVYEALPSVLLGLNGTTGFHDRMAAPRSPNGVWARVAASGGSRETERSTSTSGAGLSWTERRYGAETGIDFPLEAGVAGLSAHHRRASAEVSGNDGRIDVAGEGLGASMAWRLSDDMYVAGEVSATRYDVALKSGRRGSLRSGVGAFGHAVGVEVGRRVDLGSGPLGALTATPRARLSYSRVGMDAFTDAVDARVSLDKGRAATGVAGVALEASEGRSRVFGSVDVEHGFSRETVVRVSEVALSSQSEATRARFEVGGSVEWSGGRYALQGAARWATGARDYGGGMVFKVRF